MKRIYLLLAAFLTVLAFSCSKNDGGDSLPTANANNDPVRGSIALSISLDQPQDVSFQISGGITGIPDLEINWGNGNTTHEISHHYTNRGEYRITVTGTGINQFYCSYGSSRITAIDVRKCPNLVYLSCNSSKITGLDLSNNPHLLTLECDETNLTQLDFSKCPKLEHLSCSRGGGIERITFGNPAHLKSLYCASNKLMSLDLLQATQLTHLYCQNNQIKELNFGNSNRLQEMNCNDNQITTLDLGANASGDGFLAVYCKNNKLESLKIISSRPTHLDCSNNSIKTLDVRQCLLVGRIIAGNNQLVNLHIDGCAILGVVDCSYNGLDDAALNAIYSSLPTKNEWGSVYKIGVFGNSGTGNKSIAEAKGWTVVDTL